MEIGLFKEMSKGEGISKTATALAAAVGFDVNALRTSTRSDNSEDECLISAGPILRHLSAMGYIVETHHDKYEPNNFSMALTLPIIGDPYTL